MNNTGLHTIKCYSRLTFQLYVTQCTQKEGVLHPPTAPSDAWTMRLIIIIIIIIITDTALDPLGHHAVTCRRGGDVVTRHNQLRDVIVDFCHSARLGVKVEVGSRLTPDLRQTRPADVLVAD